MKFSSCIILQSGESSTSFNKNDRVYFSGEKKWNETIQGIHFFENTRKNFKSNLILKVFLILRSQGLQ